MASHTVFEKRDTREGSRSTFPTKIEVTTEDESFGGFEGFFFRAIANILKTVLPSPPRKHGISFGE
jgi:hypothetical protein